VTVSNKEKATKMSRADWFAVRSEHCRKTAQGCNEMSECSWIWRFKTSLFFLSI